MNNTSKSIAFVTCGLLLAAGALASNFLTRPKPVVGFEKVGEAFFETFNDPSIAKSLSVAAFDSDGVKEFTVEFKDGVWRIPSHHDYPAEAAQRLAKTASSLIGLERESLVARRETQHEKFGVIDPTGENAEAGDSTGSRITLRDQDNKILVDYIIGKPAGSAADDQPGMMSRSAVAKDDYYYVRVPGEKETYKTKVDIDLSTRFADWIEPDLLKVESETLTELLIDNYTLEEREVRTPAGYQVQVVKTVKDQSKLTKPADFGSWELEGLVTETEELETTKINELVSLMDEMTIVGVRPKLKHEGQLLMNSDLSLNRIPSLMQNPALMQDMVRRLQIDLERKGFTIGAEDGDPEKVTLVARQGELTAKTNEGVAYTLYFGKKFQGDEVAIEIGSNESDSAGNDQADNDAQAKPGDQATTQTDEISQDVTEEDGTSSRYVAIRVVFDQAALGPKPETPTKLVEPVKPDGFDAWLEERQKKEEAEKVAEQTENDQGNKPADEKPADEKPADEKPADEKPADEKPADEKPADEKPADEKPADEKPADEKPADEKPADEKPADEKPADEKPADDAPQAPQDVVDAAEKVFLDYELQLQQYTQASFKYNADLTKYETEIAEYEVREKAGKQQAKELDERFAEWYYVVPAESLAKLKLTRDDLVKVKETEPPSAVPPASPGNQPQLPTVPDIDFPGEKDADNQKADPRADPKAESKSKQSQDDKQESDKNPDG